MSSLLEMFLECKMCLYRTSSQILKKVSVTALTEYITFTLDSIRNQFILKTL